MANESSAQGNRVVQAEQAEAAAEQRGAAAEEKSAGATIESASAMKKFTGSMKKWFTTNKSGLKAGAKTAGRSVIVVGKAAGAGAAAVGRAGAAGAAVVGGAALEAAKGPAILLFIFGIIQYVLRFTYGTSTIIFALALILFVISGYAVAMRLQKERLAILLPMLFFVIWYWALDATYEPKELLIFAVIAGLIMLLVALLTKGQSIGAEAAGFLPVLFLFLDIGLLSFYTEKLNLTPTPLLENLILYMPWWAFLGLLLLPPEPTGSKLLNGLLAILKAAGAIYVIFVLVIHPFLLKEGFGDSTFKDTSSAAKSLIPAAEEFEESQARLREKLTKGEHPFISNLKCLLSGDFANLSECVAGKQTRAKIEASCKEKEEVKQEIITLEECVEEEEKKSAGQVLSAGAVDRSKKSTTLKITIPSAPLQYTARPSYSASLILENPRNQNLNLVVNCSFRKDSESIPGEISEQGKSAEQLPIQIAAEAAQIPLTCSPTKDLKAEQRTTYKMVVEATVKGMTTKSALSRAFLGQVSGIEREQATKKVLGDKSGDFRSGKSSAPADFTSISFAFGSPELNPIITSTDVPQFLASVQNNGGGRLLAIDSYSFTLSERGFSVRGGSPNCLTGKKMNVPSDAPTVFGLGSSCSLGLPSDLASFQGPPKIETFYATLVYDYAVKNQADVQVQVIKE